MHDVWVWWYRLMMVGAVAERPPLHGVLGGTSQRKQSCLRSLSFGRMAHRLLQSGLPRPAICDFEKCFVESARKRFVIKRARGPSSAQQAVETPRIQFERPLV